MHTLRFDFAIPTESLKKYYLVLDVYNLIGIKIKGISCKLCVYSRLRIQKVWKKSSVITKG